MAKKTRYTAYIGMEREENTLNISPKYLMKSLAKFPKPSTTLLLKP
jgi:hypothetical protein